jgi:hypothetical protein
VIEFTRAGADDVQDDEAAHAIKDAVLRQNEVLDYSIAFRNLETGAYEDGIIHLP